MPKPAARLTLLMGAAAALLLACGSQTSAAPPAYSVDVECQRGLPFAKAYDQLAGRYDPLVENARQRLQAARSVDEARSALDDLAGVLDQYDAALLALNAPDSETAQLLAAAVAAGSAMSREARRIGAAADPAAASQEQWPAVTSRRVEANRNLAMKAAFFSAECG
jgi:hypothetical protein